MSKILVIAWRDFLATVSTKGFIIAIMVPLLSYAAIITVFPRLMNNRVPVYSGGLVVIDPTSQVAGRTAISGAAGNGRTAGGVVQSRGGIMPMGGFAHQVLAPPWRSGR